jgi:hypothetical protein
MAHVGSEEEPLGPQQQTELEIVRRLQRAIVELRLVVALELSGKDFLSPTSLDIGALIAEL